MSETITMEKYKIDGNMDLVTAWDKLNKINNSIELYETLIATRLDVKANKLKEILVSCTISDNDKLINLLLSKDEDAQVLKRKYCEKKAYEIFILNEFDLYRRSEASVCVAFLREYALKPDKSKYSWDEIAEEMHCSISQCRRYYDEYKGVTPSDNSWSTNECQVNMNKIEK